jgi:hypothetical protein
MANAMNMDNELANERCAGCGALLSFVGRVHRCSGQAVEAPQRTERGIGTYRYRDPEKRRTYMRDLMRRKRAETKEAL